MTSSMSSELPPPPELRPLAGSVLDLIGGTPVIELPERAVGPGAPIWVKHEGGEPGGSIRDRFFKEVLDHAESTGLAVPGDELVLAGVDNAAISAALVGHARGYQITVFHPRGGDRRLVKLLMETGARLRWSPADAGLPGAVEHASAYAREQSGEAARIFLRGERPEALGAVIQRVAAEIRDVLEGQALGALVVSVTSDDAWRRYIDAARDIFPDALLAAVAFEEDGLEPGPGRLVLPAQTAWEARAWIARGAGLLLGPRGAGAVWGAVQLRDRVPAGSALVAVSIDSGLRWLGWEPAAIRDAPPLTRAPW